VLLDPEVEAIIDRALAEDLSQGDPTTEILVPPDLVAAGTFVAKAPGVLAGLEVSFGVFRRVDSRIQCKAVLQDGARLQKGDVIAEITGPMSGILMAERVALNFLQHMSGIATATNQLVEAVKGLPVRVVHTRKTLPGLRALQLHAVRVGGGDSHRKSLGDGVLIKDNHIAAMARRGFSVADVVRLARDKAPFTIRVEVEADTLEQVQQALEGRPDSILVDNMSLEDMRRAVDLCKGKALVEASGGITLENARQIAETGVDIMSSGALTHSVKGLDISLDVAV
jgi:nicotinate-nucleotide pyrophosphorylase (carboxylating)